MRTNPSWHLEQLYWSSNISNLRVLTCCPLKLFIKCIDTRQTAKNYSPLKIFLNSLIISVRSPDIVLQRGCCGLRTLSAKCLLLRPCRVTALSGSHTTTLISINTDGDLIPTLRQQVTQGLCRRWHHRRATAGHTVPRQRRTANVYKRYIRKWPINMLFQVKSPVNLSKSQVKLMFTNATREKGLLICCLSQSQVNL